MLRLGAQQGFVYVHVAKVILREGGGPGGLGTVRDSLLRAPGRLFAFFSWSVVSCVQHPFSLGWHTAPHDLSLLI